MFADSDSKRVAGVAVPPVAGTWKSGDTPRGEKTMTPSSLHAPGKSDSASASVVTVPPPAGIFRSLPLAMNAIVELSGDQNVPLASQPGRR